MEVRVDPKKGTPQGAPRRLTDWSGFSVTGLSATADGEHLQFLRSTHHHSVFVGEFKNDGNRVINARRLTTDDHSSVPFAWTPDSRRVILLSRRTQVLQVYSQALEGSTPPQLVTPAPTIDFDNVRLAPDGTGLVALGQPRGSSKENFYRVAIGGGVPQLMFVPETGTDGDFRCTNQRANFCVYALRTPHQNELILKSFDLMSGMGKEILRTPSIREPITIGRCLLTAHKLAYLKVGGTQTRSAFFRCTAAEPARFQSRVIVSSDLSIGRRIRRASLSAPLALAAPRCCTLTWMAKRKPFGSNLNPSIPGASPLPMAATSLCSAPARRRTSG
jgi:hypothetical protein